MKHYLGIDLGISSIKVVVVNQIGEIVTSSTKSYDLLTTNDKSSEGRHKDERKNS